MTTTIIDVSEDDAEHNRFPGSVELDINTIVHDDQWRFRELNPAKVSEYATVLRNNDSGAMPPIRVAKLGEVLIAIDGYHRLAALRKIGTKTVRAFVEDVETETRVSWLAAEANMRCGIPLKASDYRRALGNYVRDKQFREPGGRLKSYAEIANDLGGTRSRYTIRNWIAKDHPKLFKLMRKDDDLSNEPMKIEDERTPDEATAEAMLANLQAIMAAIPGVTSDGHRGWITYRLKEVINRMQHAQWAGAKTIACW